MTAGRVDRHVAVSVVVCTFNRCDMLPLAIDSLCEQTLDAERFDVVVVDNASTDRTREVVEEARVRHPRHAIRYLYEAEPGLGTARNTGLAHVTAPLVAYLDDDAKAAPGWLARALALIERLDDVPLCVGGRITPFYTSPVPSWFSDRYESRSWGEEPRWLRAPEAFSGSNMIWKTQVLRDAGGFDPSRGVKGTLLSLGEESVVFRSIWDRDPGARFYYDPHLVVAHWVPAAKMTVGYPLRRAFASGRDEARAALRADGRKSRYRLARHFGLELVKSVVDAVKRLPRHRRWQTWTVREGRRIVFHVGRLVALTGIDVAIRQR